MSGGDSCVARFFRDMMPTTGDASVPSPLICRSRRYGMLDDFLYFSPHLVYKSLFTLYCMQRESLLHSVGAVMKSIDFPFRFFAGLLLCHMLQLSDIVPRILSYSEEICYTLMS